MTDQTLLHEATDEVAVIRRGSTVHQLHVKALQVPYDERRGDPRDPWTRRSERATLGDMGRVWPTRRAEGRRSAAAPLRLIACFAVVVLAASCNGDGSTTDGGGSPTVPVTQPDSGCTAEYPNRLDVSTDAPEEVEYLDQVAACAAPFQSATYLRNDSEVVWTITTRAGGETVTQLTETPRLLSFRTVAPTVYRYPVLAPGSSVVVEASPSDVIWTLHPGLSAMWLSHDLFADQVAQYGEKQLVEMLAGNSLRRRALVECSLTAYQLAGETGAGLMSSEPMKQLLAGLGIFSGATRCARAWKAADNEVLRRYPRTATWTDDIARLGDDAAFIVRANQRLTRLRNLGKIIISLLS